MKSQSHQTLKLIPKAQDRAFGKDVYLLGQDNDGARLWLEAPKWECNWYWAFGYIRTYGVKSNNVQPRLARDINSHTHINSLIFRRPEKYYSSVQRVVLQSKYLYHWNELPQLVATTLTDAESWEFSDLMKSFYTLKDAAEVYYMGNSHLTSESRLSLKNADMLKQINERDIPAITSAVLGILRP